MLGSNKIGVGIIGLSAGGGWAASAHMPALRALDGYYEVVGLSASSSETARAAATAHQVGYFTDDPAELARHPDVDLVVVAVKVPHHRELVEAAIAAGKMVYCEWPLGNGLQESEYLADLARQKKVRTFVGLQARSAPPINYLRDLIQSGYVGEVLSSTVVASGGAPWGGISPSAIAYVNDSSTGATMLSIPFGHTIDALSWVLGGVERVTATLATRRRAVTLTDADRAFLASAPDQVAITGQLASGAIVAAHFRGGLSRGINFHWEINGTDGDLVVTGANGHVQYGFVEIRGGNGASEELRALPVPDKYLRVASDPASIQHTVAQAYRNVFDDIRDRSQTVPSFSDALVTHRLLAKIEACA